MHSTFLLNVWLVLPVCESKFKSCFKRQFGCNVTQYIQGRRMSQAEHLLIDTDFTMGQIAQMIGYTTSSRFAELFKKSTGILPVSIEILQEIINRDRYTLKETQRFIDIMKNSMSLFLLSFFLYRNPDFRIIVVIHCSFFCFYSFTAYTYPIPLGDLI